MLFWFNTSYYNYLLELQSFGSPEWDCWSSFSLVKHPRFESHVTLNEDKYQKSVRLRFRYCLTVFIVSLLITCIQAEETKQYNTIQYNTIHCVQKKNTHSHFLSYLHELFVDLNKNCREYTQGLIRF